MWTGILGVFFRNINHKKKKKKRVEFLRYVDCSGSPSVYKWLSFSSFNSVTTVVLLSYNLPNDLCFSCSTGKQTLEFIKCVKM